MSRFILNLACTLGFACGSLRAQTGGDELPAVSPQVAAMLAGKSVWSSKATVGTSYGYKDNLLLSHADAERSSFARGSLEYSLVRIPAARFDFSSAAQLEGTHYFSGETVEDEARVFLLSEAGFRPRESLKFALPIAGYYWDQVFDQSETELERLVSELKVAGISIGPSLRWWMRPTWWAEVQGVFERKRYDDGANDGDVGEGNASIGWTPHERFEVSLTASRRWRDFDSRTQYNSAGRAILDTQLKIAEREAAARVEYAWDAARRWESVLRASFRDYADNGPGFFNFKERRIDHELEWTGEKWAAQLSGAAARIDYGVQKIGLGIAPPPRVRDEFSARLRLERKFGERWLGFAEYSWERNRSNDVIASYTVNEGLLGARWSWEK